MAAEDTTGEELFQRPWIIAIKSEMLQH